MSNPVTPVTGKVSGNTSANTSMNISAPTPGTGVISFEQIQQATARCLQVHPAIDAILPKESFLLAELLGLMIYARRETIDAASVPPAMLEELRRWSAPPALRAAA